MVALNFSKQFAQAVAAGTKRQTIRDRTSIRAATKLQLYTGYLSKDHRKLTDALCLSVQSIIMMKTLVQPHGNVAIVGMFLEDFAKADGFATYADMWAFFEPRADENGEYRGVLIRW